MYKALIAGIAGALLLAGCGLTGGKLVRPGEPTGSIVVFNQGSRAIEAVTISTCDAASHGLNRMNQGQVIQPGRGLRFTVSRGCYDVAAGYGLGGGSYAYAERRLNVQAGRETRLNITGAN